jgi:hypothetical protein
MVPWFETAAGWVAFALELVATSMIAFGAAQGLFRLFFSGPGRLGSLERRRTAWLAFGA